MALKSPQKSLKNWTDQKWTTKSGKPSTQGSKATGERYLPEKAIKSLSSSEYAATTKKKREDTKKGKQEASNRVRQAMGDPITHYRRTIADNYNGTAIAFCCSVADADAVAEVRDRARPEELDVVPPEAGGVEFVTWTRRRDVGHDGSGSTGWSVR